ncbi:hypothetical protein [Parashewanella tropica]|uniref:hypothetical protein n=1 Tax=Parashewanella tropica TaxID=2547970 RepID=UPI00105932AD|nr:hypothetical protein [Parashewanella tropica]
MAAGTCSTTAQPLNIEWGTASSTTPAKVTATEAEYLQEKQEAAANFRHFKSKVVPSYYPKSGFTEQYQQFAKTCLEKMSAKDCSPEDFFKNLIDLREFETHAACRPNIAVQYRSTPSGDWSLSLYAEGQCIGYFQQDREHPQLAETTQAVGLLAFKEVLFQQLKVSRQQQKGRLKLLPNDEHDLYNDTCTQVQQIVDASNPLDLIGVFERFVNALPRQARMPLNIQINSLSGNRTQFCIMAGECTLKQFTGPTVPKYTIKFKAMQKALVIMQMSDKYQCYEEFQEHVKTMTNSVLGVSKRVRVWLTLRKDFICDECTGCSWITMEEGDEDPVTVHFYMGKQGELPVMTFGANKGTESYDSFKTMEQNVAKTNADAMAEYQLPRLKELEGQLHGMVPSAIPTAIQQAKLDFAKVMPNKEFAQKFNSITDKAMDRCVADRMTQDKNNLHMFRIAELEEEDITILIARVDDTKLAAHDRASAFVKLTEALQQLPRQQLEMRMNEDFEFELVINNQVWVKLNGSEQELSYLDENMEAFTKVKAKEHDAQESATTVKDYLDGIKVAKDRAAAAKAPSNGRFGIFTGVVSWLSTSASNLETVESYVKRLAAVDEKEFLRLCDSNQPEYKQLFAIVGDKAQLRTIAEGLKRKTVRVTSMDNQLFKYNQLLEFAGLI